MLHKARKNGREITAERPMNLTITYMFVALAVCIASKPAGQDNDQRRHKTLNGTMMIIIVRIAVVPTK